MSTTLGLIGGTGAVELFECLERRAIETPWGSPSAELARVRLGASEAWFLARHGNPHRIAPHRVNYRANIDAFRQLGVEEIVAVNAVGGIDPELDAGALVVPDQLIDYTWGREATFANDEDRPLVHIEFGEPFSPALRARLLALGQQADLTVHDGGCCAVTQGPRLETAAEVARLARDGATLVGMTSMPEAALAREAGIAYASLCVVANPAAGVSDEPISLEEIDAVLARAMGGVRRLLSMLG
ncbi:S-methyl-5'-thioinosine phosphorylase [Wenzhouxiangella marina]|uniref:Probable 6-oxopurine nucleoside phosphorylase n=1 Tax=Wenzhouxiangella marina TaxID=1579979 RepID=A0A0K0XVS9_9GAMM|nr:S-methyl-5'-thioinosine phosphorylase [Wenzhouxiangella marina]AKS41727.1 Purine nucleoside phosphorylase [Wenzhouxiangella marina]MBB6086511.1 5'-methylthioinosine phosphorylase [Wenzhouxiangella marina]